MFLASEPLTGRHSKIRSFLPAEPLIAVILAAIDFEWTVRRGVIALGTNSNKAIREGVLKRCSGPDAYLRAWNQEVKARFGMGLHEVIKDWPFLKDDAYPMRHRIVHGLYGKPNPVKAALRVEAFLNASQAVEAFAADRGIRLFVKRLPVRRKPLAK